MQMNAKKNKQCKQGRTDQAGPPATQPKSLPLKVVYVISAAVAVFTVCFVWLWLAQGSKQAPRARGLHTALNAPPKVQAVHTQLASLVGSSHVDKNGNSYFIRGFFLRDFHEYTLGNQTRAVFPRG